ncbi:MAG: DUF1343 domain-containing protein [Anaerolineae bacterium]
MGQRVKTGLEVLLADGAAALRGRRVGLVTNPTGVTSDLTPNVTALLAAGVNLVALFGPEHGFDSSVQDALAVGEGRDTATGLTIYSLYGATDKPTPAMLAGVDALLFDVQDAGVRFYTYPWTLALCMVAAAEAGIPVVVLDRPNPIRGDVCEGPVLESGFESFVGAYRVPLRYGLTVGELARLLNQEFSIGADLSVVKMQGWRRGLWYADSGLPWVQPSPNLPTLDTTLVYPGLCLVEGTTLSEGRGTTKPFEVAGAPWLDGARLAAILNARSLPGVRFRGAAFTPTFDKFSGQLCRGVQVHVLDRSVFRPIETGLRLLAAAREIAPHDFGWRPAPGDSRPHFDLLMGNAWVRQALDAGAPVEEIIARWGPELAVWRDLRTRYFLYDD